MQCTYIRSCKKDNGTIMHHIISNIIHLGPANLHMIVASSLLCTYVYNMHNM